MNEIAEVTEKTRAVASTIKCLEQDIVLLKRKAICHFLTKQTVFAILSGKKKGNFRTCCASEILNDELKNI